MTADMPDAVKVLERLIAAAKLLYANAEGCALNHHGADFELHGMPGWLADCAADIAAAQALGARAMQDAMAGRVVSHWVVDDGPYDAQVFTHRETAEAWANTNGGRVYAAILSALEPTGAQEGADEVQELAQRLSEISPHSGILFEGPGYEVRLNWLTDAKNGLTATPAPDVPWLVRRAHRIADDLKMLGLSTAEAEIRQAADALETLHAEVDGWRKATWEAREGIVQRDERLPLLMNGWTARATAAEAERDALKAEVERKDKALRAYQQIADAEGWGDRPGDHPMREAARRHGAAALSPAKAGG